MLKRWRHWREDRQLARIVLSQDQWHEAIAVYPRADRLPPELMARWQDLALRFLLRKQFHSGSGFVITDQVRLRIAALATLPVLGLGLDWYNGWYSVVVYETAFLSPFEEHDENGLVSHEREARSGEAWLRGPVILSWEDISDLDDPDSNVVIHEFAHKLDMRNGDADGYPPLHRDMSPARWQQVMQAAWQASQKAADHNEPTLIDPYALEGAGEFFSVLSEQFFMRPEILRKHWPEVYEQLALFYRYEPISQLLYPW
ncbi:MAG: Zn-dependent hydrolase [Gammaproteobacteria bacterium HGW-Gammaproteobacteria-14]|nr:MAG: Zn-dependent hydrolase [Gammaproteobacteria bacterium HGW-Gammaproteobacteria-14]